jgi:hypothetical protein
MDTNLFLQNNDNLAPREDVRLEKVEAAPYPDRRRVKVKVHITPFKEQPNFEITIRDRDDVPVARTTVIAPMHFQMEFVLHLRDIDDPTGDYTVQVALYYDEDIHNPQDTRTVDLHIPPGTSS